MRPTHLLAAAAAVLAGACNAEQSGGNASGGSTPVEAVAPPANGDWSQVVTQTAEGGYLMGNPNADVKVIEFGSMTCPHCATFAAEGVEPLVQNYVKPGRVAFEFRNFVRDPLDITMALIARCGGKERFFPLTDALFDSQRQIFDRVQGVSQEEQQALAQLPPAQQFAGFARAAGLQEWAAQRGVPAARLQQCLSDQAEIDRLVQMTSDATTTHNVQGTPSFIVDGELAENTAAWQSLEPKIREALGQ